MSRVSELNRHLRDYDDKLFCRLDSGGAIQILRRVTTLDTFTWEGDRFWYSRPFDHYIFSLTEDWSASGRPVDWGSFPVMNRLKALDLWSNQNSMEEIFTGYEKDAASKERARTNSIESFLLDFRRQFARATNEVNTGTLDKKLDKRRLRNGS